METLIVNTKVALPKPGRKAPKMDKHEFINVLYGEYLKVTKDTGDIQSDTDLIHNIIGTDYEYTDTVFSKLWEDIEKVEGLRGAENYEMKEIAITESGVPYVIIMAGNDWEEPALYMIYWDGKKLRGYVPTYGNCFNRKTKSLFGNDDEMDAEFLAKELKNIFLEDETFYSTYRLTFDIDKCKEDFEHRIIAI